MNEFDAQTGHSALRKGRVSLPDQAYFITKCAAAPGTVDLARPVCAKIVVDSILWARDNGWWRVLGLGIMPDHYHLAMALGHAKSLQETIGGVDRFTATRINRELGRRGSFWQEGFHDHAIRDRRDFDGILDYIHLNPVVAGLVDAPEDWTWSTANAEYAKEIDWDWLGVSLSSSVRGVLRFDPSKLPARYR